LKVFKQHCITLETDIRKWDTNQKSLHVVYPRFFSPKNSSDNLKKGGKIVLRFSARNGTSVDKWERRNRILDRNFWFAC